MSALYLIISLKRGGNMSSKSLNAGIFQLTIVCWYLSGHSVFGNLNHTHFVGSSHYDVGHATTTVESGRQFVGSPQYSSDYISNPFKPLFPTPKSKSRSGMIGVRSGTIKMRMVENNPVMDQPDQPEDHEYEDKPYPYPIPHNDAPLIMHAQGGGGHQQYFMPRPQPYNHDPFSHIHDIETKEAALKGFGVGLAIGLGALGGVAGLFKVIFIPLLALSALLPFLLLLTAPIPVITMGKMFGAVKRNGKGQDAIRLQDAIEDVMKKLPELESTKS